MAFTSASFVLFVCAACLACCCLPPRWRYLGLLGCNLIFYALAFRGQALYTPAFLRAWGLSASLPVWPFTLGLLLLICLVAYACALALSQARRGGGRAVFLCLGALGCLGVWAACKYCGLLSPLQVYAAPLAASDPAPPPAAMPLPLGLSFFSVQAAGYVADVYRGHAQAEKNPLRCLAFLSFFPALPQGPLQRAGAFLPQLKSPAPFAYDKAAGGLFRILWGLCKALVVAGAAAPFTREVFAAPTLASGPVLAAAAVLFAWQLTYGFSGCCDVAAGAARMLGFSCGENFARPFAAQTFPELWRRWYASLGGLLHDHVTLPLSEGGPAGRLRPAARRAVALAATLLAGLLFAAWHGVAAGYLLWGLCAGGLVAASRLCRPFFEKAAGRLPPALLRVRGAWRRLAVFGCFCACLLLFASAWFGVPFSQWAGRLAAGWGPASLAGLGPVWARLQLTAPRLATVLCGVAVVEGVEAFAVRETSTVADWIRRRRFFVRWPLYYALLAAVLVLGVLGGGIYASF